MSDNKKNLKGFSTFSHDTIAEIQRSAQRRNLSNSWIRS